MSLQSLLDNAQQLPSIPKVVQELIESFGDEDVNIDEIARKIAADQALTAKVLRMANSARFGGNRKVGSVNDAVVVLGFNALRTLVLASGLTSAFKAPEHFDLKQFWKNSFTVASLCKWLAPKAKLDREVAFTCGMMHNVGSLLIHLLKPVQAQSIDHQEAQIAARAARQSHELGFDFTDAGSALAERWKFPDEMVAAIRAQLTPVSNADASPYAAVIYLANFIHNLNACDHRDAMIAEFPRDVARALNIDADALIASLDETQALDEDMEALLG